MPPKPLSQTVYFFHGHRILLVFKISVYIPKFISKTVLLKSPGSDSERTRRTSTLGDRAQDLPASLQHPVFSARGTWCFVLGKGSAPSPLGPPNGNLVMTGSEEKSRKCNIDRSMSREGRRDRGGVWLHDGNSLGKAA